MTNHQYQREYEQQQQSARIIIDSDHEADDYRNNITMKNSSFIGPNDEYVCAGCKCMLQSIWAVLCVAC